MRHALQRLIPFLLTGYARQDFDAHQTCGECYAKWSAGAFFPRRCRSCDNVRGGSSQVCEGQEHADCMLPDCACGCHVV